MRALLTRLLIVFVLLSVVVLVTFAIWGDYWEAVLQPQRTAEWFARARPTAWAVGMGLLISDLVLPVPATPVMAALGAVYGPWLGGALATIGSMVSGAVGYLVARLGQRRFLHWLAQPDDVRSFQAWFDRWGGLAVAVGRSFPVLPEVTSVLAGLAGMHPVRFGLALGLGSAVNGFLYAAMGSMDRPLLSFLIASGVPMLLWGPLLRRWKSPAPPQ